MKKITPFLAIFLFLMPLVLGLEQSIGQSMPYYPNYDNTGHYYSVLFDGEGESSAVARLNFKNTKPTQIDTIRLEIPGNNIRIINAVEQYYNYKKVCIEYDNSQQSIEVKKIENSVSINPRCLKYNTVKDYIPTYVSADYTKDITSNALLLNIRLKSPLQPQETTTIIVYYKSKDYTTKSTGVFNYNFETIKTNFDVDYAQVGISVNEGLYLKEGKTNVNYRDNLAISSMLSKSSFSEAEGAELYRSVSNVGQGSYVKTARALDPLESFNVKGKYSSSWTLLNIWKFTVSAIMSIIILGLLVLALIKSFRFIRKDNSIAKPIASGFIFAFTFSALWALFFLMMKYFSRIFGYRSELIFLIIGVIILGVASLAIIFGPAIYFATKYKPTFSIWYISSFVISIIIIGFVIGIILFLIYNNNPTINYPYRGIYD